MKVIATIINMPESILQTNKDSFDDFYKEILEDWGGPEYRLSRDSIIDDLDKIKPTDSNIEDYENGIVIRFRRNPEETIDYRYDEVLSATPAEFAEMYIFDDGEIYYLHRGYVQLGDACYCGVSGIYDIEFDTTQMTKDFEIKLGAKMELDILKGLSAKFKSGLILKRREKLLKEIGMAIAKSEYDESVLIFDPKYGGFLDKFNNRLTPEQQLYFKR